MVWYGIKPTNQPTNQPYFIKKTYRETSLNSILLLQYSIDFCRLNYVFSEMTYVLCDILHITDYCTHFSVYIHVSSAECIYSVSLQEQDVTEGEYLSFVW